MAPEAYKKNESAGGVMGMIQQIAEDSKAMENEAIRSESDAQKAYEDFVKETNASIETKGKEIVNKSEEKSKSEGDLVQSKEAPDSASAQRLGDASKRPFLGLTLGRCVCVCRDLTHTIEVVHLSRLSVPRPLNL